MPVSYVGKPPTADVEADIADIKAVVEDIQSASGSREETLTLSIAPGDDPVAVLTNDPTVFKTAGTDIFNTAPEEIFRFVVDTPEIGTRDVISLHFDLSWQTRIITGSTGNGQSYWQIGSGNAPSVWRTITDVLPATEVVEDHGRSGDFLPDEASNLPFTIRLMGRVIIGGDTLRTDILSTSQIAITYKAL